MNEDNKLILIGNGFDLAHGLKTTYKDFLDWYVCEAFNQYCANKDYKDTLIEISNVYSGMISNFPRMPITFEEALEFISSSKLQSINYPSIFFKKLIESYKANNWVDIERFYFRLLKKTFSNSNITNKEEAVTKLNKEFDFLIIQLTKYIETVNKLILKIPKLPINNLRSALGKTFTDHNSNSKIKFLNFNYTETLYSKRYANDDEIIHIHGRVADIKDNPIIFGYGDESDPSYQSIEDSGENIYLEHIKSFGYFRTKNYHQLLSYIDSAPYVVYIVGHSCGLSDRVLLNQIFEHDNCKKIEIFYHVRNDGTDNFKEITQEISRHFKPQNKNMMRRRVGDKNYQNIIPQNKLA